MTTITVNLVCTVILMVILTAIRSDFTVRPLVTDTPGVFDGSDVTFSLSSVCEDCFSPYFTDRKAEIQTVWPG